MYERILLPTDGQRGSKQAMEHALTVAAAVDADVHGLYVVDEGIFGAYSGDEFVQEHEGVEATLEEVGEAALAAMAEEATTRDVSVETVLRYGHPHEEILDYADDADVDLIVIGTRTQPGEYRQLLGSVTDKVARLADQPVTVVKTQDEE